MTPSSSQDRLGTPEAAHGQRLHGWKEIASYLGRGERTVKRWESERDLPVHRLPGGRRAAVHAYAIELEQWLQSNSATTSDNLSTGITSAPPAPQFLVKTRWPWIAAAAIIIATLTATVFSAISRAHTHPPAKIVRTAVSSSEQFIAHNLYLQGRFEWSKRTPESLQRALDDFTQSINHDPTSAPSYAGIADTYLLLREYTPMPQREAYSHAIAAATMAVTLDDSLAEAHRSLAFAEVWGKWDFRTGEREFLRAIQLDPRDPLTHLWFATAFEVPEWFANTQREFDRARELDPSSAVVLANESIWLFNSGRTQEGLTMARQVEQVEPDFAAPHRYLASMSWHLRDYPAFIAETDRTAKLKHDPQLSRIADAARTGYAQDGESGLLRHLYALQKQLYSEGKLYGAPLAITCIRMGDKEQAIQFLQDDLAHHRPGVLGILTDIDLRTLASEPRFQQILARLDIPPPPSS